MRQRYIQNRRDFDANISKHLFENTQARPDVQAYRLLKFSKFSCITRNRPQPLITRGSSIWWRGQIDLGFC